MVMLILDNRPYKGETGPWHILCVFLHRQRKPRPFLLWHRSWSRRDLILNTFPKKDDPRFMEADWRTFHVSYDERFASVMLDRSVKGEEDKLFEEEIEEFSQRLEPHCQTAAGKQAVQDLLGNTEQIFACYIPDDITEHGWELVEALLEIAARHDKRHASSRWRRLVRQRRRTAAGNGVMSKELWQRYLHTLRKCYVLGSFSFAISDVLSQCLIRMGTV